MLLTAIFEHTPEAIIQLLLSVPVILLSLSVHEAAHAFVAYKLGDPTARNLGRLTLNPFKHINPFGFISMLVIGIGWANPVPINTRNFKNPRKGMMLSALAGPVSNLLLGIIFCLLEGFAQTFNYYQMYMGHYQDFMFWFSFSLWAITYIGAVLNFALAIFNLIPAPPFDGSRIFFYFLPKNWYFKVMRYEQYIGLGIILVLVVLSRFFNISPVSFVADLIHGLVFYPFDRMSQALLALFIG